MWGPPMSLKAERHSQHQGVGIEVRLEPVAPEGLKLSSGLKWVTRYSPNRARFLWNCHATPAPTFTPTDASTSDWLFGGPKLVVSSAAVTNSATPALI